MRGTPDAQATRPDREGCLQSGGITRKKNMFVILETMDISKLFQESSRGDRNAGEVRKTWRSFGTANEWRRMVIASWECRWESRSLITFSWCIRVSKEMTMASSTKGDPNEDAWTGGTYWRPGRWIAHYWLMTGPWQSIQISPHWVASRGPCPAPQGVSDLLWYLPMYCQWSHHLNRIHSNQTLSWTQIREWWYRTARDQWGHPVEYSTFRGGNLETIPQENGWAGVSRVDIR